MNPPQLEITRAGLLSGPFGCVLNMPTGSGKTWLAQQAVQQAVAAGGRAVYLTPLRALAAEVAERWSTTLRGTPVGVFTGDYGATGKPVPVPFDKARVLVMTPERLDACTRAWRNHWNWVPEVDLLVVDEIHLLAESNRGPRLEGALSRFRRLNPFCRIIGLTATLGNPEEVAEWLDGTVYRSRWRPVPLAWRVAHFRNPAEKPVILQREVERNVNGGGKSLVFVQSRRRAEELSRRLAGSGVRARHHHAGLTHDRRWDTEETLRTGGVDVLVATGTLETGLNLPVRQVVLYDLQTFDGRDFVPLTTNSVWQRVGRAGRPGLDDSGEAVLLCPTWNRTAAHYQAGRFEPARSHLNRPAALAEQVVAEVASGSATTRSQLRRALRQTLGGHQGIVSDADRTVSAMCDAGLLREWNDPDRPRAGPVLKATKAGRVAARHMLTPETVLAVQRSGRAFPDLTYFDLLVVVAATPDCEPVVAVDFEELDSLAAALAAEASYLLRRTARELLETLAVSPRRLLSALKMAAVARTWTRLGDADKAAEAGDCYPYEVTRLAESIGRLLQAVEELHAATEEPGGVAPEPDEPTRLERMKALRQMVAHGIDERAVTLCFVPSIGGTFARRLAGRGVGDIEDLAGAEPEDLAGLKGLSEKRARQWIDEAARTIKTRHALRLRDVGPKSEAGTSGWPRDVDPYRLRRSLDLKVQTVGPGAYRVTGGLEPHEVTVSGPAWACDCVDRERGNACKHLLAVKRVRRDDEVTRLVGSLTSGAGNGLDLLQLWLGR